MNYKQGQTSLWLMLDQTIFLCLQLVKLTQAPQKSQLLRTAGHRIFTFLAGLPNALVTPSRHLRENK